MHTDRSQLKRGVSFSFTKLHDVNESVKELGNCSSFTWSMAYPNDSPGYCSAVNYTGGVCRQQLQAWQECAVGGAGGAFLDLSFREQSQEERERDVANFLYFLVKLYLKEMMKVVTDASLD